MLRLRAALAILACSMLIAGLGCSGDGVVESIRGTGEATKLKISLPSQILGLQVSPEDVSAAVKKVERRYVDAVGVFSLREEELLRATLQVSRFNGLARPGSAEFRSSIIGLLGAQNPLEVRVADTVIYSTSGNQQTIFVWFEGQGFFVLSVHQDYEFPRTLLRRILKLGVKV